jgi:GNAT superfamily N-acetyltransferase
MLTTPPEVTFAAVSEDNFDELAAVRVAAMRESLERLGRFDPQRARDRLRASFVPEHTRFIVGENENVGFYAVCTRAERLCLDHLYIHPRFQRRGIGRFVLGQIVRDADARGLCVSVVALRESASNRFYQRLGFVQTGEGEWDIYYTRPPTKRTLT